MNTSFVAEIIIFDKTLNAAIKSLNEQNAFVGRMSHDKKSLEFPLYLVTDSTQSDIPIEIALTNTRETKKKKKYSMYLETNCFYKKQKKIVSAYNVYFLTWHALYRPVFPYGRTAAKGRRRGQQRKIFFLFFYCRVAIGIFYVDGQYASLYTQCINIKVYNKSSK